MNASSRESKGRQRAGSQEAIDVLMPTYNSVRYLESALRSVEKAVPSNRLIVADHHSNDGTLEVLDRHGAYVFQDDKSLGHARQLLFDKSTSRIVLMFDSDVVIDEEGWFQTAIELLNTKVEHGKRVGAVALLPNLNPPVELEKFKRFWWRLLPSLEREFFVTHSTLFLRESVEGIHIPEQLGAAEDVYIWLHIRKRGYVSRTINVAGTHYFTFSEKKGRWMGANLRILQSFVGKEALQFVLRNVLFYPFLALVAAVFTWDFRVLQYNIKRWFGYLVGYLFPARYRQIERG
jgi:glycosyltransferase involved in cell wall biosynthesis